MNDNKCPGCDGRGKTWYSCCGDQMYGTMAEDLMMCPTCQEHTGDADDEAEECETCNGTGLATK